jgi:hypothetical protein
MASLVTKIGLGGIGVFAIGMLGVTAIEAGKDKIQDLVHSDSDIRIPLMGVVPFNLGTEQIGRIDHLTLLRDGPEQLRGVQVEADLNDSVSIGLLKDCTYLTVNDPEELNDRTRFQCLYDSTGYSSFGFVEIHHHRDNGQTTLKRTLLLTPAQMAGLQADMGPRVQADSFRFERYEAMAESIEAITQVQIQIAREQAQLLRDSARAGRGARVVRVVPPAAPAPPAPGTDTSRQALPRP